MIVRCYLCGTDKELTRDHIPPQGFFPPPKPNNLITVPCCGRCNQSYALDDEAFRLWVTAPAEISPAGEWVQENKVFKSTFRRSPKLAENVMRHIFETEIDGEKRDVITMPQDRADRFLIRITKGLLAHFYPSFPYQSQNYRVTHLGMMREGWGEAAVLRDQAVYDFRGPGVFQFRRNVSSELKRGYWFYSFYEASLFLVWHDEQAASQDLAAEKP